MGTVIERSDLARDALYNKVNVMVDERLSKDTISNCILEISQKHILTLENNVLTMKAGSTPVYAGDTYAEAVVENDYSITISEVDGIYVMFPTAVSFGQPRPIGRVASGKSTQFPTSGLNNRNIFYDTDDKKIYAYSSSEQTWKSWGVCYPCCLIKVENGVASFAKDSHGNDMIFNGAGYIGHHIFVYPQNSGLTPFGLDDGQLRSNNTTTQALKILEASQGDSYGTGRYIGLELNNVFDWSGYTEIDNEEDFDASKMWLRQYVKTTNNLYVSSNGINKLRQDGTPLIRYILNSDNQFEVFDIRQPVRLATTEMLDKVQDQVDTNTSDIANKQDTLVSGTNIKTINSTTVLGSGDFALADQSLSNLDSTGQMVVDSQNGTISNCILEIPQNLSISASGTSITLKGGSVCTMTGSSTYTTTTIASDITRNFSIWENGKFYLLYNGVDNTTAYNMNTVTSGSSLPETGSSGAHFFLTSDFSIYNWQTGSSSWVKQSNAYSYPLCTFTKNSSGITIDKDSNGNDMIFNGAGFIGHHIFTFPSPKYLSGNGKTDGKLVSYSQTLNTVAISEMKSTALTGDWFKAIVIRGNNNTVAGTTFCRNVQHFSELLQQSARLQYVEDDNICYAYSSSGWQSQSRLFYIRYEYDGTTVTDFTIRQPYEGARNLLTDDIEEEIATKANDSDVVKLTGDQTIAGSKTYSSGINVLGTSNAPYSLRRTGITKGTAPSSTVESRWRMTEGGGVTSAYSIGGMRVSYNSNGNITTSLQAFKPEAGSTAYADIGIVYPASGAAYTFAPTPTEDTTSSVQIDTVGARNTKLASYALDSNTVHKTDNETIAGEKTLADKLTVDDNISLTNNQNTYRHVFTDNSAITKGTTPSANTGTEILLRDSNNVNIGSISTWYNTSGTICTALRAYNPTAGTTDSAVVQVNYTADGKTYATAPTPAISDDSNKIVTTEWFNDKLVLVNELPANPNSNVWYAIPESNS